MFCLLRPKIEKWGMYARNMEEPVTNIGWYEQATTPDLQINVHQVLQTKLKKEAQFVTMEAGKEKVGNSSHATHPRYLF